MSRANVDLVFDGLDAGAQVYLNGTQVLSADNMFRVWRVHAKASLHAGKNQLRVVFPSPIKAAAAVASVLVIGRYLTRPVLRVIAGANIREVFTAFALLLVFGIAQLMNLAGISMALGAFLAGVLLASSEYKHALETDIEPFKGLLLGLFFIAVGMRLDPMLVMAHWPLVLVLTIAPVMFKFLLVTLLARLFGAAPGAALRTGLYLAQAGEFGFVLLSLANEQHLFPDSLRGPVLASMVLSMLATPFIVMYSDRIVMRLSANDWLLQSVAMTTIAKRTINTERHVIICGFGRSGQNLARLLEAEKIAYIALDLDPDRVLQAATAGQSVVFGDAARLQSLMAAGLARASAVVVSYHDTPSALKILHLVHSHAPTVPVIVRTIDDVDLKPAARALIAFNEEAVGPQRRRDLGGPRGGDARSDRSDCDTNGESCRKNPYCSSKVQSPTHDDLLCRFRAYAAGQMAFRTSSVAATRRRLKVPRTRAASV
jgi:hypothetical protein